MSYDFLIETMSNATLPPEQRWLWPYRIPMDKFTLVSGDWGAGKTHALFNVVTCVLKQEPFPDGDVSGVDPGKVLIITTESSTGEIQQIFRAQGITEEDEPLILRLSFLQDSTQPDHHIMFDLDAHMKELQAVVDKHHPIVVIFDPLIEFHSRKDIDTKAIRGLMVMLNEFCEKNRLAGMGMIHWNKDSKLDRRYRTSGSQQYSAGVKSVIIVERDPKNKDRRIFVQEKMTLGPEPPDLYFSIEKPDGLVIWEKPAEVDLSPVIMQAQLWLLENLSVHPMTPSEVYEACPINQRVIRQARARLRSQIVTVRHYQGYKTIERWEITGPSNNWGIGPKLNTG